MAGEPYARDENWSQNLRPPLHLAGDPAQEIRLERERRRAELAQRWRERAEQMAEIMRRAELHAQGIVEPLAADPATEDARYLAAFRAGMEAVLEAQALQRAAVASGDSRALRVISG